MSLLKVSSGTGVKETERNEDSGIQSSTVLRVDPDRYKAEMRLLCCSNWVLFTGGKSLFMREEIVYKIRVATGPESS